MSKRRKRGTELGELGEPFSVTRTQPTIVTQPFAPSITPT